MCFFFLKIFIKCHYAQVPESNSIKAVLVDGESVGSVDAPGCGAKILCDVDELTKCSKSEIIRNLKVFSNDPHLNSLSC